MKTPPFELNSEQEAAVSYVGEPLLIIAGAGTGKTRVITERIARLLEKNPDLRPQEILALTFTDRATEEMAGRIRARLADHEEGKVRVHTFHSFALRLLKEQSAHLRQEKETELLDNIDFWILLRRHIERLDLQVFWKNAEPGKFLKDLIEFMSRANDELVSVEDYEHYVQQLESKCVGNPEGAAADEALKREREIARVYRIASELLAEACAQTYGDVIASAVRLLQQNPEVRRYYETHIRAVLVDEFQDTNVAQIELLDLIAQSHQNITVVGDDDQGIYRFRGASSESFNMFARKFSRFRQMKLTQNYRSTRRILRVANQLISTNPDRFDPAKNLWTEKGEGSPASLVESSEPDDEALAVAERIENLHRQGRAYQDIAVLYRAHAHRDLLIKALRRNGIPFQVTGLSVLFHPAVRDILSAARLLVRLHDNVSCARVLALPQWNLTEPELVFLIHRTALHSRRDQTGRPSLLEVVEEFVPQAGEQDLREKLDSFLAWFRSLRKILAEQPALRALKIIVSEVTAGPAPRQKALGDLTVFDSNALVQPVRRFLEFAKAWQEKNPHAVLKEFLEYFDLFLEAGGDVTEDAKELSSGDAVRLMTVHASKGLEFPVVFVLRLTQGYFPTRRRTTLIPFPEALRKEGELPPGDFHTQEERRLCYVALTRAQEELVLSSVVKSRWKPSEFLADLERDKNIWAHDLTAVPVPRSGEDLANELTLDLRADEKQIAYSRLPFWSLRNRGMFPIDTTPENLKLSASSMETYETCPLQYKFAHEYKLSAGPNAALTVGAILHECLKQFFVWKKTEGTFPFSKMKQLLDERWRSIGFEDDYQEKRYRAEALEQLQRFYEKNLEAEVNVLEQEKEFEFGLGELTLIGRIDQMNEEESGRVELLDYKTGRPREQKDAEKSLQLSVYALACREYFGRPTALLSFYNLATGEKVSTERSAAQLELDRARMEEIAAKIRRREFPPKKGYMCGYCNFLPVCPAWEEE